jgi:hypothetical protein
MSQITGSLACQGALPEVARRPRGLQLIPILLCLATGSSGTLWTVAQIDDSMTDIAPIWLALIVTLTAWPSYLAYRFRSQMREEIATACERAYQDGFGNGYLSGAADRISR